MPKKILVLISNDGRKLHVGYVGRAVVAATDMEKIPAIVRNGAKIEQHHVLKDEFEYAVNWAKSYWRHWNYKPIFIG